MTAKEESELLFKRIFIALLVAEHKQRLDYSKAHYRKNRASQIAQSCAWRAANPDKAAIYAKRSAQKPANKQKRAVSRKKWTAINREKLLAQNRAYQKLKQATDPVYRMVRSFRVRLWRSVRTAKRPRAWALIGCSALELRAHLQSLFKDGMTWENYGYGEGKWVVDHKRPVASFDLTIAEQQSACWNHKNLQPLWWRENMQKHAKLAVV